MKKWMKKGTIDSKENSFSLVDTLNSKKSNNEEENKSTFGGKRRRRGRDEKNDTIGKSKRKLIF